MSKGFVMGTQKCSITLVNNRTENFTWSYEQACTSLYVGKDEKYKLDRSLELTDDKRLCEVYSSLENILKSSIGQNTIVLLLEKTYLTRLKTWLRTTFDDAFLKTIKHLVVDPKISVQCKFQPNNITWTEEISLNNNPLQNFETDVGRFDFKISSVTYSILFQWSESLTRKNRCNVLKKMFTDKTFADCSILTADETEIRCHESILAANSDVLQTMLLSGLQESQTKRIEMTDLSGRVVNELLSYLYGLEINIGQMKDDIAFDLLRAAHKYNIVSLEEDTLKTLLLKLDKDFKMDMVLAMYYFTSNVKQFQKLWEKSSNILRRNTKALVSSSAYQELLRTDPREASKLALKLLEVGSDCIKCNNGK